MKSPLISVIVPVYKSKFLRQSLNSILSQSYKNIELLIINDGSPDPLCQKIIEEFSARDPRVRPFLKPNGGHAAARNFGMRHMRGEYLMFVDDDDLLAPHALKKLQAKAHATGCDIVMFLFQKFNNRGRKLPHDPAYATCLRHLSQKVYRPDEITDYFFSLAFFSWNCFLRTSLLNRYNEPFPPGRSYDDNHYHMFYRLRARTLTALNQPLYYFRVGHRSATERIKTAHGDALYILKMMGESNRSFLQNSPRLRFFYHKYMGNLFAWHLSLIIQSPPTPQLLEVIAGMKSMMAGVDYSYNVALSAQAEIFAAHSPAGIFLELLRRAGAQKTFKKSAAEIFGNAKTQEQVLELLDKKLI